MEVNQRGKISGKHYLHLLVCGCGITGMLLTFETGEKFFGASKPSVGGKIHPTGRYFTRHPASICIPGYKLFNSMLQ